MGFEPIEGALPRQAPMEKGGCRGRWYPCVAWTRTVNSSMSLLAGSAVLQTAGCPARDDLADHRNGRLWMLQTGRHTSAVLTHVPSGSVYPDAFPGNAGSHGRCVFQPCGVLQPPDAGCDIRLKMKFSKSVRDLEARIHP